MGCKTFALSDRSEFVVGSARIPNPGLLEDFMLES